MPTKQGGGGVPLHVNPTDPKLIADRNAARIRRLRLKLGEMLGRRSRGVTGPAVSDERIQRYLEELQRRGAVAPVAQVAEQVARQLVDAGLSEAGVDQISEIIVSGYHAAVLNGSK